MSKQAIDVATITGELSRLAGEYLVAAKKEHHDLRLKHVGCSVCDRNRRLVAITKKLAKLGGASPTKKRDALCEDVCCGCWAICTRKQGHRGEHSARVGKEKRLHVWPNE